MKKITKTSSIVMLATVGMFLGIASQALASTYPTFVSSMGIGSTGTQVQGLQSFLSTNSTIYPSGIASGYYGALTKDAVTQFQAAYDLPQVGIVGPVTISKLNGLVTAGYGLDIFPAAISNVSIQTGSLSTNINWSTDEQAQGKVFYSPSPIQETEEQKSFTAPYIGGTAVQSNTNYQYSQTVTLNGLLPNTVYYYVIMATDTSGNVSVTTQGNFRTNL